MILETEVKPDKLKDTTIEDAEANRDMVEKLNYLVEEGFIEIEEDEQGNVRAYPRD